VTCHPDREPTNPCWEARSASDAARTQMPAALRILIVGGGIAGLGLCRALQQQGVVPDIIERVASWPSGGTGLYIPGNGVRALEALGLADQVLARAVCMSHQRILNNTGRQLSEIELAQMWGRVGPCVGIARGELHRVLLYRRDYQPLLDEP
jgi:2-polyprenyl-6-methoxyphenol hydroxylase-like FAD-dependent oxidoreductase